MRSAPVALLPLVMLAAATTGVAQTTPSASQAPPPHVGEFVERHCVECHGDGVVKADLDLTVAPGDEVGRLWRWSRMRERVVAHEMPPLHVAEVTDAERSRFAEWVDGELARRVPALAADPGSVTIRRLSRAQWRNTIDDLLGVAPDIAALPVDDLGYGFDSIGDALTFSTLHLEKYLAAAQAVAAEVFHGEDPANPVRRPFAAASMRAERERSVVVRGDAANLLSNTTIDCRVPLPRDGVYRLRVQAFGKQAGDEPARMRVSVDGRAVELVDVPNRSPEEFVVEARLSGGVRTVGLAFVNDHYDPDNEDPRQRDRNLAVESLVVEGPVDERPTPPEQAWLQEAAGHGRTPAARMRAFVRAALPRLWRGAGDQASRGRLQRAALAKLKAGESELEVRRFALTAALVSPWFLFRVEDPDGSAADRREELATRLSYLLWASAPDETLRTASLDDADAIAAEVDRMLDDPRAERLATDFAAQWLELRALDESAPDPSRFPGFDDDLRASLRRETELLFLTVLREQRDVRELLTADYTHVDARLAAHYGYARDDGADPGAFVRVPITDDGRRRGVLGHASVQTITSNPTRTSPVKRGKWILDNLLGQAPPPPPPGNDSLPDEAAIDSSATLREQMAQHRERSKCAVCHVRMDALGLAMERFDAIGRFRTTDSGGEIDAGGELPDGRALDGLRSLGDLLAADPTFVRTLTHKLFVYAVGRDLRPLDRLRVDLAVRDLLRRERVTLRDLLLLVVRDPAFSRRAG